MQPKILLVFLVGLVAAGRYRPDQPIMVYVNKVGPYANVHETYPFYSLALCRPSQIIHRPLSLGQLLEGDRMAESSFRIFFGKPVKQASLCGRRRLGPVDVNALIAAIEADYYFEMVIDDLRVHEFVGELAEERAVFPHRHRYWLSTHYNFTIYHYDNEILDVRLKMATGPGGYVELQRDHTHDVEFGFTVTFRSMVKGSERRDDETVGDFFTSRTVRVQWMTVANTALIVLVLAFVVFAIVARAVSRDLSQLELAKGGSLADDDLLLENGWKTIGADVFRRPTQPMLLAAVLGTGAQLLVLAAAMLVIGATNLVHMHRHGMINTLAVVLYALTSVIGGLVSARSYVQLAPDARRWIASVNVTYLLFVGPLALIWSVNNCVAWAAGSTQALPWTTVLVLLVIWLFVGYPLTVVGAALGKNLAPPVTTPCRTRTVPRELPPLSWTHEITAQSALAGVLPFFAIVVELYYIFSTIWGRDYFTLYYMLLLVYILLLAVVACVSIALTYFQLNREDYRWWWRSVFLGGSIGVFVFLYGVYFLLFKSGMSGVVQITEYFTHLALIAYAFFLAAGTVSHLAAHRFISYIYSAVKTD